MKLHQIITDEIALAQFIQDLPDLKVHERYYVALFARKKYANDLIKSSDKAQLTRFTTSKEDMFRKIRQLEIPEGRYYLGKSEAPQESLALYINLNPRNMIKAAYEMGKACWDMIKNECPRIDIESMSQIQKSKGTRHFVSFDIDSKDVPVTDDMFLEIFGDAYDIKPYFVVETRGGFHVIVKPEYANLAVRKFNSISLGGTLDTQWYKKIIATFPVDQSGELLLPIPGTHQGGFTPKIII